MMSCAFDYIGRLLTFTVGVAAIALLATMATQGGVPAAAAYTFAGGLDVYLANAIFRRSNPHAG